MTKLSVLASLFVATVLTFPQLVNAQADPVYDAFESYKTCIKAIKQEGTQTVTAENYRAFCKAELNRLKGVSQESFPEIEKIIQKWLSVE